MKLRLQIVILSLITLYSCSGDSDTLGFEQGHMLKLRLKNQAEDYKIEGNEVNEIGYFFSKKKVDDFQKTMVSGCRSTWLDAPIDFKIEFIHRSQETFETKHLLEVGTYSHGSSESKLRIQFTYKDENGVKWISSNDVRSFPDEKSTLIIHSIEPRYSQINGNLMQRLNTTFDIWFVNDSNERKHFTGKMNAIVANTF